MDKKGTFADLRQLLKQIEKILKLFLA